jgi:hypothetical protein
MTVLFRLGLIVLAMLSAADLAAPLLTDGETPPLEIALIGCALGAISVVLIIFAWRGSRAAAIGLVVVRVLSALTAVPAFLIPGIPPLPMFLAGAAITLTVTGSGLVLAGLRRPAPARVR